MREKIESLEAKYDKQFHIIFDTIKKLILKQKEEPAKPIIGFHVKKKESSDKHEGK